MFSSLLVKSCSVSKPLPLSCLNISRFFSTDLNHEKVETVNLAYATYESTKTTEGEGPSPLIIQHGLFGSKANWTSLSKAFHQKTLPQRKIIAVDSRNHGDSPHMNTHRYRDQAEDIIILMQNLNIKKACFLGHSMGGRAGMMLALKYPEMIEKLIVADISPCPTPTLSGTGEIFDLLKKVQMPKKGPMSNARMELDKQLAKKISSKVLRSFLLTNLVQKSDGTFDWRINLPILSASFKDHILTFPTITGVQFKAPTLFIGGTASDYLPKSDQPLILKIFPNAEFQYIEGAGHWLHSEKPTEFLRICLEFLNK